MFLECEPVLIISRVFSIVVMKGFGGWLLMVFATEGP